MTKLVHYLLTKKKRTSFDLKWLSNDHGLCCYSIWSSHSEFLNLLNGPNILHFSVKVRNGKSYWNVEKYLRWPTLVFTTHVFAQSSKKYNVFIPFKNCFDTIYEIKLYNLKQKPLFFWGGGLYCRSERYKISMSNASFILFTNYIVNACLLSECDYFIFCYFLVIFYM